MTKWMIVTSSCATTPVTAASTTPMALTKTARRSMSERSTGSRARVSSVPIAGATGTPSLVAAASRCS